ncbi:MAG TPA: cohesin domain-containing protein [Candidatus Angelobacter sp.]|jgi:adhesin HecA-like repeat protein|nr:cohesin domain-containing protein [Candidatus Angelobacter sp.]
MHRVRIALIVAGLFLASVLSLPSFADGVPILSIAPSSSNVGAGSNVVLDVNIANVTDLFAFQFDLSFAPGTVSAASIGEGAFLAGGGTTAFIPGTIDNVGGTIAATADTLIGPGPGVNGSGTLAILTLTGMTAGTSSIDFSNVFLLDSNLNPIIASLQSGSVAVTSTGVPEPGTLVLLIAGMSLLAVNLLRKHIGL